MNIILVSENLAKAKTITVGAPQLALLGIGSLSVVIVLAVVLHYAILRLAPDLKLSYLTPLTPTSQDESGLLQVDVRDSVNAMAIRLGQIQAQLLRLDTLGDRLARLAGFKPQELMFGEAPGQGGAAPAVSAPGLSLGDMTQQLDLLTRQLDDRGDKLGILESLFRLDHAKQQLVPTMAPVEGGWYSSNYGWRIDPFTGQRTFHEGIDFMAEQGTAIRAAAGGLVAYSGFHPQYGNMIEVDHGNSLITRYAHASKLRVKIGDVVLRGATIAEVGKTGRATGTHLHFEVRRRGVSQDPTRFLQLPG